MLRRRGQPPIRTVTEMPAFSPAIAEDGTICRPARRGRNCLSEPTTASIGGLYRFADAEGGAVMPLAGEVIFAVSSVSKVVGKP